MPHYSHYFKTARILGYSGVITITTGAIIMHVSNIRADTVPCHLPACQARKNHDSATPCQPVLGRLAEGKTARTKKTRSPLLSNSPIGVGICAPVASQCMLILARTVMPFSGCRLLRAEYIGTGSELLKSRVSGTKNRINEYETLLSQNRSGSDAIHGQHGHQEQCLQSSSFWSGIAQRGSENVSRASKTGGAVAEAESTRMRLLSGWTAIPLVVCSLVQLSTRGRGREAPSQSASGPCASSS